MSRGDQDDFCFKRLVLCQFISVISKRTINQAHYIKHVGVELSHGSFSFSRLSLKSAFSQEFTRQNRMFIQELANMFMTQ